MAEAQAGVVTPVTPPASTDAPGSESTADLNPERPEGAEPEPSQPEKTFTQKELNDIIAKEKAKESRRAERTARAEIERAARAEAERDLYRQQLEKGRTAQPPGAPNQKDFDVYDDYLIARAKYELKQEQAQEREAKQRQTAQERQQSSVRELAEAVQERFSKAQEKYADFDEVVKAPHVPFTEPMAAFFAESDTGGDLAYHLATHLDEAKRIAGLSPGGVFRELVKLEAKLTAAPKPTQTPAPIVPNRGGSTVAKSMLDMSQEEFEKHRKARLARK